MNAVSKASAVALGYPAQEPDKAAARKQNYIVKL